MNTTDERWAKSPESVTTVGDEIRRRRLKLGITSDQLAEQITLAGSKASGDIVRLWELDKRNIDVDRLLPLAVALRCKPTDLVKPLDKRLPK